MRLALLGAAVLLAAPFVSRAEEAKPPLSEKLHADNPGYPLYQQYCAVCHGVFADGHGLVVPVLKVKPTDLRHLAQRYGSPLPTAKLAGFIDGSEPVLAHGSREMPIWGTRLYEVPSPTPNMPKRGAIQLILNYLQAIQEKGS